jgi:Histidine kinase-, DNA gyrase B-, and HSP90-like ATPase.
MTNILIYFVLPLLGSIFIMYTVFFSMNRIGTNLSTGLWKRRMIAIGYTGVSLAFSFLGNGIINLVVLLIIPVIGHYFYNNLRIYIMYYTALVVAVYLTDIVINTIISLMISHGMIYFINTESYYILLVITTRLIEFMILRILVWVIQRKLHEQISIKQLIGYFILPLYSVLNLFSMVYFIQVYPSEENMFLFTINIVILIGLNIYFAGVFDVISKNNHLENELSLNQQQQQIHVRYYENLEQKYDSTRKLIHDIRNHIQAMEQLYEVQKNEEGCQYAKDVHAMLNQMGHKYYTDNKILNIILNDKVQTMQANGITDDIKIGVDIHFVRDVDLTSLFANILDNAIEAARQSEEKYIVLRIAAVHDFITITLKNSIAHQPIKQGNSFLSTKDNHEGLGLKNAEWVVKKYKGDIQYEWGEKYFITRIMFAN